MARAHLALALLAAGFRRHATYRQAIAAGAFTNTVFGFLRCYVLLSIAAEAGTVGGYDAARLVAYVWLGQGLLAVVDSWTPLELGERVRTGDVVADLLRPVDPLRMYLFGDLGRAGLAMVTRFAVPVAVGALAFGLYLPRWPPTYPLFLVSVLLAVVVGFACRYLIALSGFWLLDVRGVSTLWVFVSGAASGLYFPLGVLPDWLVVALWVGTPFPSLLQGPLDVAVERGGVGHALAVVGGQAAWAAALLVLCALVQARAVRRLVVQGG